MNREGKTSLLCFRGETGKHKGFKNLRVLTLVGSNPIGSTINQKYIYNYDISIQKKSSN